MPFPSTIPLVIEFTEILSIPRYSLSMSHLKFFMRHKENNMYTAIMVFMMNKRCRKGHYR